MRKLIIDTNLLCLLIVGLVGKNWIAHHKRLRAYTTEDFDNLTDVSSRFPVILTSPHILTEVSNLTRQTTEPLKSLVADSLTRFVSAAREFTLPAIEVVQNPGFKKLGLADAVMLMLNEEAVLLSDDLDLYLEATAAGLPAINYNYLRDGALEISDFLRL